MSHGELVARAERWLRNSAVAWSESGWKRKIKCTVTATELQCATSETPDAIGWSCGGYVSIVIECKTSRSDFLRDAKKHFRRYPDSGMGLYRYYMACPGLISADELPERWGLLETSGSVVRVKWTAAPQQEHNLRAEMAALFSLSRRTLMEPV